MTCPDCGCDLNGREATCPNCGRVFRETYSRSNVVPRNETEIDLLRQQVELQKIQIQQKERELQMLKAIGDIEVINTQHTMYQSVLQTLRRN